ncbi:hypothetical protein GDO81_024076 [Engystomops pustulosus]|uniref:Secreted protein n=1 Tax=Engystomops pustulosus TaxID=76066 RepID=A0AAV6ZKK9_ENGPU|nr:hypothetical protein GDO81_024076 [Engystomops pustulosus]
MIYTRGQWGRCLVVVFIDLLYYSIHRTGLRIHERPCLWRIMSRLILSRSSSCEQFECTRRIRGESRIAEAAFFNLIFQDLVFFHLF